MKSILKKAGIITALCLASCSFNVQTTVKPEDLQTKPKSAQERSYKDYEGLDNKLGAYYTVEEYKEKINELVKENPKIVSSEKIGESWHKRPIYALKISDKDSVRDEAIDNSKVKKWYYKYKKPKKKELKEPQILILAHQHARELISGMTAMATAEYLIKNYSKDEKVKNYVDNNEIYIIPLANPDGLAIIEGSFKQVVDAEKAKKYLEDPLYMYNPLHPGKGIDIDTKLKEIRWRKNARDNDDDGIILPPRDGVDLNRNYSTGWTKTTKEHGFLLTYPGPRPFSEPETKAVKKMVEQLDNLVIAVDLHSYLGMIIYPPVYKKIELKDEELYKKITKEMVRKQPHQKYDIGDPNSEVFDGSIGGTFIDWVYTEHNAISFLIEIYKKEKEYFSSIFNFNPPQQDIKKVTENVIPMLLYLFEISDNPKKVLKEYLINKSEISLY